MNTLVGILDQAFHLTDEEQFHTLDIIGRLLESLDIPDRSTPKQISPSLMLEVTASVYSTQLHGPRSSNLVRPVRAAVPSDIVVSVEAWCEALLSMITTAYPDLTPTERIVTAKILTDLLDALGAPDRAASFFPDDVIRAALDVDAP